MTAVLLGNFVYSLAAQFIFQNYTTNFMTDASSPLEVKCDRDLIRIASYLGTLLSDSFCRFIRGTIVRSVPPMLGHKEGLKDRLLYNICS